MTAYSRISARLPPPLTDAPESLIGQVLGAISLQIDAFNEDLDRMRQTHWVNFAYRVEDLDKLAALLGIERFEWEHLRLFRARLLALVAARLRGAVGPEEIKRFVLDYLRGVQGAVDGLTLAPGLTESADADAYGPIAARPLYRPFRFVETPPRRVRSKALAARRGRVPYLFRWSDTNAGLDLARPRIVIAGYPDGATASPVLVNLTTGAAIGYRGTVRFGERLVIEAGGSDGQARARIDDRDVTHGLYSLGAVQLGTPWTPDDLDTTPALPEIARGANDWVFLLVGHFGEPSLSRAFFALASDALREGVWNRTRFGEAVFAGGTRAGLSLTWDESTPASFEIGVPQHLVAEPETINALSGDAPHVLVARALGLMIERLRAAGVRARVRHDRFTERMAVRDSFRTSFHTLPPERTGAARTRIAQGGRFDDTALGRSRFE
jgi:hypothetical protein